MSWIESRVSGKWIDPDRLNPWRQGRPRARGPVSEAEDRVAWQVLGDYFRAQANQQAKPHRG